MKFIYITKPLPVFNKKFRENSGNPSSMFIYKKTGYKEKLRLLYSASFGQKMRSFVSECRLRTYIYIYTLHRQDIVLMYDMHVFAYDMYRERQ